MNKKLDKVPTVLGDGIFVVEERDNSILVAFRFQHMGQESPEYFTYHNKKWKVGELEIIPEKLIGNVCTVREYTFHSHAYPDLYIGKCKRCGSTVTSTLPKPHQCCRWGGCNGTLDKWRPLDDVMPAPSQIRTILSKLPMSATSLYAKSMFEDFMEELNILGIFLLPHDDFGLNPSLSQADVLELAKMLSSNPNSFAIAFEQTFIDYSNPEWDEDEEEDTEHSILVVRGGYGREDEDDFWNSVAVLFARNRNFRTLVTKLINA